MSSPDGLRYYRKSVGLLTEDEYEECRTCNMGAFGQMQDRLHEFRFSRTRAFALMLWDDDGLIGWALKYYKLNGWHVYVYVRPDFRRKGYGAFLIKESRRGMRSPLAIYPWDNASADFYTNVYQPGFVNKGKVDLYV